MKLEDWRAAGNHFAFRGHRIFYREEGSGPPLICIHGFPSASWAWHRIWPELTARFRVIAPDMLGFGFSDKPREHLYSLHEQTDLHEALVGALGIESTDVLAHDYGVSIAQEMLARRSESQASRPSRVGMRSVCFLNGGLFPEARRPRFIQDLLRGPFGSVAARFVSEGVFRRSFSGIFGPLTRPSDRELRDFWQLIVRGDGRWVAHDLLRYLDDRKQHRDRWVDALRHSDIPMRLISGTDDPVAGRHTSEIYRKRVPDADVVLLEGIGHYPQLEAPKQVVDHFLSFIGAHAERES
jgi:pimeloyl-ACP methyl ester carboxylesterase